MASHATFNALTYIQHQITDDAKREALKALSQFASFIRKTSDDIELVLRDSQKEYEMLQIYCTMEQWRFEDRLSINIAPLPSNFSPKMTSFTLVPFAEHIILLGLAVQQEITIDFTFEKKQNQSIINATYNFNLHRSTSVQKLTEKFSQEQINRYNLLMERITLLENKYPIKMILNKQIAQLIITL